MPFKIVQTVEHGGSPYLTIVPYYWETQGILQWPPKNKNISKLLKDGNSKPHSDWTTMPCFVKRKYFTTLALAEKELSIMEHNSDTDVNERNEEPTTSVQMDNVDYDALAETLMNTRNNNIPPLPPIRNHPSPINNINNISNTSTNNSLKQANGADVPSGEVILQLCNNETVVSKIETLLSIVKNQNHILENMANKMSIMSVQLEEINEKQNQRNEYPMNVTLLKQVNPEENESFSFSIIENQGQLDALEVTLSDKEQYKKLKKRLSFLCSSLAGNGTTCAYRLLDTLLTREFITNCSWSGRSRGDTSKVPLKNYKLFRKFFFDLVHSWDETFTVEDTEKFLKAVVRNSMKRQKMKNLRESGKKIRKNKQPLLQKTSTLNATSKKGDNNIQTCNTEVPARMMPIQNNITADMVQHVMPIANNGITDMEEDLIAF